MSPHRPAISVLLPVYNSERYLSSAVDSIVAQTATDYELLLVDDGSTDRSRLILEDYAARDPRCRILGGKHRGLVGALNLGLAEARGELVARMDADDFSYPDRFAEQRTFLEHHPEVVALGCRVLQADPKLRPIFTTDDMPSLHAPIECDLLQGKAGAIVHSALMARTATLRQIAGYRTEYESVEDADLYLRLAEVGRLANLESVHHTVRNHFDSIRHRHFQQQRRRLRHAVEEAWRRRGKNPPSDLVLPLERISEHGDEGAYERWRRRAWVDLALAHGHPRTARIHAWWLLLRQPRDRDSWRRLRRALLTGGS